MIPINNDLPGDVEHLRPWLIIDQNKPACWKLGDGRIAVALFSDQERAAAYARETSTVLVACQQPEPATLVKVLIACVEANISSAVLNPSQGQALRIFDLVAVLKKIRDDLRAGQSTEWIEG